MKNIIKLIVFGVLMSGIPLYAQKQKQSLPPLYAGGCNWVFSQLHWKDGQTVTTIEAQLVIQRLNLPSGWVMDPQSSIDALLNLNSDAIPRLLYHCDTLQEKVPKKLVTFYFTYQNGNQVVKLPQIHIFIN